MPSLVLSSILVCAGLALSGAEGSTKQWPWKRWCKQRLLPINNSTACVVDTRSELPPVNKTSSFDLYYGLHLLSAGGNVAKLLDLSHSTLMVRESGKPLGEGLNMVIEYAATFFGPQCLVPIINANGALTWHDEAEVAWYPWANMSKWISEAKVVHVGIVSGATLDKWFDQIPKYKSSHLGYGLWSAMDGQDVTTAKPFLPSNTCHDFTQQGLTTLYQLGGQLDQQVPMCRNYFAFQTTSEPTLVPTVELPDVRRFYTDLSRIVHRQFANLTDFGNFFRSELSKMNHIYIHEKTNAERYWKVAIVFPYMSKNLAQRMVLPWQNSSVVADCSLRGPTVESHILVI